MYKAKQNFAAAGKTYLVGDEVPAQVAKAVDTSLVEQPKAKKTTKYIPEDISEGEE